MKRTNAPKTRPAPTYLLHTLRSSGFLALNKTLIKQYGLEATAFLSIILDKFEYHRSKNSLKSGRWFFVTNDTLMETIGVSEYGLRNAKKFWKEEGVIKTKMAGAPAKQHYSIDWFQLERSILEASPCEINEASPDDFDRAYNENKDNDNKERKSVRVESGESSKDSVSKRNKKYLPLAKHLGATVKQAKNYKINTSRLKSWSNDMRLLHEQDGVEPKRMKAVLKWYRKNIDGEYIPVAYSGSAFRSKFIRLEDAMKRKSNGSRKSNVATAHREKNKTYQTEGEI